MEKKSDAPRLERRSMEVRELRADDDARRIEGYAAVFNEETDIGGMFREVIRPGAFKRAIKEKQEIFALKNHDSNLLLGGTGNGTLKLREDERGLWIEVEPINTQTARDAVEEVRSGLIKKMSFAFIAGEKGDNWPKREDGKLPLRELVDLEGVYDVSIVTRPAYQGTSVGLRSAESVYQEYVNSREGQEPAAEDETEPVRQVPSDVGHVVDEILNL